MRCVLNDGDKIVDCPPTFTMYAFDAAVNNAKVVTVPRLEGFRLDVPGRACPNIHIDLHCEMLTLFLSFEVGGCLQQSRYFDSFLSIPVDFFADFRLF